MAAVSGKTKLTVSAGELGFSDKVGGQVEAIEGVKQAVPVIENRSWLAGSGESLMVMGVDLLQEKAVRSYKSEGKAIIGDSLTFITHPDSIILTDSFARAHGTKMGDKLELLTARGKQVFTAQCNGPWVLIELPAGSYKVHATGQKGQYAKDFAISVKAGAQASKTIRLP